MIKRNCDENFNYICNNSYRENVFKDKLTILLVHIHDYKNNYNSKNINKNISEQFNFDIKINYDNNRI